ncbi:MAG TPA: alpha/beta fold hydrolase [Chitinophagaceae bacterium]|nr:alpha/beta fold hydrolase [Chitinophagaceae bacterium]
MKKTIAISILLLFIVNSIPAQTYSVEETIFRNDTLTLFADIYTPQKPISQTGITIIQGSGNSDRSNVWARSFAEFLAQHGYYVLLPDKRGSGKSGGNWRTASFEDLASDVRASAHHLKKTKNLRATGVLGLSQGGFIAPIVASQDNTISFVIDIAGAAVTLEEQIIHEVSNTAKKAGLQPSDIVQVLDLHVLFRQYAIDRNWAPLEKKIKELERSNWSSFLKTFPSKPDLWVWNWVRLNISFDPMVYWKKVKQDVLVAYGAKDQDDNMPVFESIYRLQKGFSEAGKKNYTINLYQAGHALYEDDKATLRKEFLTDLLAWLKNR